MNPQDPAQYNPNFDPVKHENVGDELSVRRPNERLVCEIKRHPIGIIGVYAMIIFTLVVVAVVAFGVVPSVTKNSGSSDLAAEIGAIVLLFMFIISAIFGFIANKVYWGNRWVVTSDSLTQISQTGLFNRQSSQLALHNIEDVTAEQNGILAQFFKYGVLKVETAGEHSKFLFLYCPNPNYYAKTIIQAREEFEMQSHAHTAG